MVPPSPYADVALRVMGVVLACCAAVFGIVYGRKKIVGHLELRIVAAPIATAFVGAIGTFYPQRWYDGGVSAALRMLWAVSALSAFATLTLRINAPEITARAIEAYRRVALAVLAALVMAPITSVVGAVSTFGAMRLACELIALMIVLAGAYGCVALRWATAISLRGLALIVATAISAIAIPMCLTAERAAARQLSASVVGCIGAALLLVSPPERRQRQNAKASPSSSSSGSSSVARSLEAYTSYPSLEEEGDDGISDDEDDIYHRTGCSTICHAMNPMQLAIDTRRTFEDAKRTWRLTQHSPRFVSPLIQEADL